MKKIVCILLCLLLPAVLTACSNSSQEESSAPSSAPESSAAQEESSQEEVLGELLTDTFGKLQDGTGYYIDVTMIVEGGTNSTSSSENRQSSETERMSYHYQVAVDQNSDRAMLMMQMPDGTTGHLLIDNKVCYKLDDEAHTYMKQDYPYNAYSFGRLYTTDLYLGMMNYLHLDSSGTGDFRLSEDGKAATLDYEKYRLTADEQESNPFQEAVITYYFKDRKPYAEVLETDKGKTTFLFTTVSDTVKDPSVFAIPEGYQEIPAEAS